METDVAVYVKLKVIGLVLATFAKNFETSFVEMELLKEMSNVMMDSHSKVGMDAPFFAKWSQAGFAQEVALEISKRSVDAKKFDVSFDLPRKLKSKLIFLLIKYPSNFIISSNLTPIRKL